MELCPLDKLLTARHYALSHHLNHQLPQLKSKLQCAIRRAKRKYAANVEQSLKSTNSRQSWKQLKSLLKMNKPNSKCHLPAEALNTFYTRFEKDIPPPILPEITDVTPSVSHEEVMRALHSVNIKKSSGPDAIPNKLLKIAAYSLGEPLCNLFNTCISQGVFPDIWKMSHIIPIPKKAGADEAKEFRPIALTSTISKLFERLLLKFLKPHLTDSTQFAYQQNRSTEDAVAYLLDIVSQHLDDNAKNHARCLLIDYSSAFNTISPTTLINQLTTTSLNRAIVNRVYDFMTNRSQKVCTEHSLSPALSTSVGTPQGCVLSPL